MRIAGKAKGQAASERRCPPARARRFSTRRMRPPAIRAARSWSATAPAIAARIADRRAAAAKSGHTHETGARERAAVVNVEKPCDLVVHVLAAVVGHSTRPAAASPPLPFLPRRLRHHP